MPNIVLLIHGPNLNLLGQRNQQHYGTLTLADIEKLVAVQAEKHGLKIKSFQSNHEGALIDFIQRQTTTAMGIIINPGALTHYSYALHDALLDTHLPCVEVHLSDISNREPWRQISVTAPVCLAVISGKREQGYLEALDKLLRPPKL